MSYVSHMKEDALIAKCREVLPEELFRLIGSFVKPRILPVCHECKIKFDPIEKPLSLSLGYCFYCSKYCFDMMSKKAMRKRVEEEV